MALYYASTTTEGKHDICRARYNLTGVKKRYCSDACLITSHNGLSTKKWTWSLMSSFPPEELADYVAHVT